MKKTNTLQETANSVATCLRCASGTTMQHNRRHPARRHFSKLRAAVLFAAIATSGILLSLATMTSCADTNAAEQTSGIANYTGGPRNTTNITGYWSCTASEQVVSFGESVPAWTFDLKLTDNGEDIYGDYLVTTPFEKFDGNWGIFDDVDNFDIKGSWDGSRYVVKYTSSWEGRVTATIRPISSNKIEWRVLSVKDGGSMAPDYAVLTKTKRP